MANTVDIQILVAWAHVIIGAISLVIALIGLRGYRNVRNWKSLFLAVAFLIIFLSSVAYIPPSISAGQWSNPLGGDVSGTNQIILALSTVFQSVAFVLLAAIYYDQLRAHIIEFSRLQLDALSATLATILVTVSYIAFKSAPNFAYGLLALATFFFAAVSTVLLLLISVSLFSYWRRGGDSNTLLTSIGFFFVLVYEVLIVLSYDQSFLPWTNLVASGLAGLIAVAVSLVGYASFLFAIVRLRVRHAGG